MNVVGESHYQPALRAIYENGQVKFTAFLKTEPDNPHDANAVAVCGPSGDTLGYLDRQAASEYHEILARKGGVECPARLTGGTQNRPTFGVVLDWPPIREQPAHSTNNAHGQPVNVRFNRARRAERDVSEILGLAQGVLADGVVNDAEARFLRSWVSSHGDTADRWPVNILKARLDRIFEDGVVSDAERRDLVELLESMVGGNGGIIGAEHHPSSDLPVDRPPPKLVWAGSVFVLTGKFAFGCRDDCEGRIRALGGTCYSWLSKRTNYVVIGTFGSRDWLHTSFGRKIQKAVQYRDAGQPLAIVAEEHWATELKHAR